MACLNKGMLQTYLDGQLDIITTERFDKHLKGCEQCRKLLETVNKTTQLTNGILKDYRSSFEAMHVESPRLAELANPPRNRKVISLLGRYRKPAAAVLVCALVTMCFSVQPVRGFISDALKVFRVESIKGFSITMNDLEQVRNNLESKGDINLTIDSVGKMARSGFETVEADIGSVSEVSGFPVLAPKSDGSDSISITVVKPGRLEFTPNVKSINNVLKTLGSEKLLPDSVDGKTISADFSTVVSMASKSGANEFTMVQSMAPKISVPADVSEDDIYSCLVQLPILPDDIKQKLALIKDWKSTVYIPVIGSDSKDTTIRGFDGISSERPDKSGSYAAWLENGVIIAVNSNTSLDELMSFINGLGKLEQ